MVEHGGFSEGEPPRPEELLLKGHRLPEHGGNVWTWI
jgi:hypothetical protein